jgi:phage shock protein E
MNIPHDQMQMRYSELAAYRNHRIIVYCRSGRRSEVAAAVLREQGFPFVENGGGFDALVAGGVTATQ